MKRVLMPLLLATTVQLSAFEYGLTPSKVNAQTDCFFGKAEVMNTKNNGNMVNSCFVNMGTGYLVIDSGPSYLYAKEAYSQMKKINDLPILMVINTHAHDDHWLGNAYYKELNVPILGAEAFKEETKLDQTRMEKNISPEAYAGTKQIFPTQWVKNEKSIEIEGQKVVLQSVNKKGHSKSDLFVYIPKFKMLFAGDLVFNERIPSLRDGDISHWIETLETIKAMDLSYIIGGHGTNIDKHAIDATYTYLTLLKERVSQAIEEGEEIEDTVNSVTMNAFKDFKMYQTLHRQNVEVAYRMLEWEQ